MCCLSYLIVSENFGFRFVITFWKLSAILRVFRLLCFLFSFSNDLLIVPFLGFPGGSDGKECACNAGDMGSIPAWGRFPGEGNGNPLQYSCLEKSHGQRSLVGYSPWGCKESDTTEQLNHHHLSLRTKLVSLRHVWLFATPWMVAPLSHGVGWNSAIGWNSVFQARILQRVASPFSRGSSRPRDWTQASCIAGRFFTIWATREVQFTWVGLDSCI